VVFLSKTRNGATHVEVVISSTFGRGFDSRRLHRLALEHVPYSVPGRVKMHRAPVLVPIRPDCAFQGQSIIPMSDKPKLLSDPDAVAKASNRLFEALEHPPGRRLHAGLYGSEEQPTKTDGGYECPDCKGLLERDRRPIRDASLYRCKTCSTNWIQYWRSRANGGWRKR